MRITFLPLIRLLICGHLGLIASLAAADQDTVPQAAELFKFEQEAQKTNNRDYEMILLALKNLSRQPPDDEKVRSCLQLEGEIKALLSELDNTALRQSSLNVLIDQLLGKSTLLPQDGTFLNHFQQKLVGMGQEQITIRNVLQRQYRELGKILHSIPPPQQFKTRSGLEMTLIGRGQQACYVSTQLISTQTFQAITEFAQTGQRPAPFLSASPPQGEITLPQAQEFCRQLSRLEAFDFRLPERLELALMERHNLHPELAIWSRSEWAPDWEQQEIAKRFGCKMYGIWDPARTLRRDNPTGFVGELPQAAYPQLGLVVITAVSTGNQLRLERIRGELMQEAVKP